MKKLCIVIPIYKNVLDEDELFSLNSVKKNHSNADIIIVAPLDLRVLNIPIDLECTYEYFSKKFFKNVNGYSKLLLSPHFYKRFISRYEYMLIIQTDALLLKKINEDFEKFYCYDYIGAEWKIPVIGYAYSFRGISLVKSLFHPRECRVGNGGFSLRKISSCYNLIKKKKKYTVIWNNGEDVFFAYHGMDGDSGFEIASPEISRNFAVEEGIEDALKKNDIPYGVHAWKKYCSNIDLKLYI